MTESSSALVTVTSVARFMAYSFYETFRRLPSLPIDRRQPMPFALLVVILGIARLSPPLSAQHAPRVRVEPSGNVTVQARNVPLSVVLARLAAEGVEVVVPELPP